MDSYRNVVVPMSIRGDGVKYIVKIVANDYEIMKSTDHDLLIRIDQQVSDLRKEVNDIRTGTASQVNSLEIRVRSLEDNQNVNKGDSKGISNTWKIVIIVMGLIISFLTYYATMIK